MGMGYFWKIDFPITFFRPIFGKAKPILAAHARHRKGRPKLKVGVGGGGKCERVNLNGRID